jgi:hypothetical protein
MDYYSKLSSDIFYRKKDEVGNSILKEVGNDRVVMILDYLYTHTDRRGINSFTLESLIVGCGYKCDPRNDIKNKRIGNNEQFRNVLEKLVELKAIKVNCEIKNILVNKNILCTLELDMTNRYVQIHDWEKGKIFNQTVMKLDNIKLLIYFCYLKCRIYKRSKQELADSAIGLGSKAEITWVSYKTITEDLGISDKTITKYNEVLTAIDLIRIGNAGKWYYTDDKTKETRESANIYTLFNSARSIWKDNLKDGIKLYKILEQNEDKTFVK